MGARPTSNGMNATHYAEALMAVSSGEEGGNLRDTLKRLRALLVLRGHQKLLPAILRACSLELSKRARASTVTMRTVRGIPQKRILEEYAKILPKEYALKTIADETLASGFVLETPHHRIDGSGKRALRELYQKILAG